MINLLPTENKKQLRASIHNQILLRYIFLLVLALFLSAGIFGFIYISLKQSQDVFKAQEAENNQKIVQYANMQKNATELSKNINQTKNVLSKRVDYSKVLFKLASILPTGVSISDIKLEAKLFEGEKKLVINLTNADQASDIKKVLEDSKLFKSVSIFSVTNTERSKQATYNVVFDIKGFEL